VRRIEPPRRGDEVLIAAKLRPTDTEARDVVRSHLVERLDATARVALVAAPPGFGKTTLVRQWAMRSTVPTAWLSLDLLDENRITFWQHFIVATRRVLSGVDEEPLLALTERPDGHFFLKVLIAEIERSPDVGALVLDDASRLTEPSVLDALALIVERCGDRLHLVLTARADPLLPLARWRAASWLVDVRADDLRFDDEEAVALADHHDGVALSRDSIIDINRRVDGWPIAVHLALLAASASDAVVLDPWEDRSPSPGGVAPPVVLPVGEILAQLPAVHRQAALDLSVVDWFDAEVARHLAGPGAGALVEELERRQLLLSSIDDRPGARRFHRLFRDLLDAELRWRDPVRHERQHRAAAEIWMRRGDLGAAYRHLAAVGATSAADELILLPVLDAVDRAAPGEVRQLVSRLPRALRTDDAALAHDLGLAYFLAGDRTLAAHWCQQLEALADPGRVEHRARLHALRALLALYDGQLDRGADDVAAVEQLTLAADVGGLAVRRFPLVAARVALYDERLTEARRWVERLGTMAGAEVHARVTVPALEAWLELLSGRLYRASALVAPAIPWAEQWGSQHNGSLELFATAAWCDLAAGRLSEAEHHAALARLAAEVQRYDWNRLRAGIVSVEVHLAAARPEEALAVVHDVRLSLDDATSVFAQQLDVVEAKALHRLGRAHEAEQKLVRVHADTADTAGTRLVRASIALSSNRHREVLGLLEACDEWNLARRLEAQLLRAGCVESDRRTRLVQATLEEADRTGWVSPFLGHSGPVDELLLGQPLERLHPALAEHLRNGPLRAVPAVAVSEPLTHREQTIVELLPSHLSYAEIGERLFLSVNTVKHNLKSVYRKLAVTSRSEAVTAARAAGLL
jgi:LuxR family maltose regulon positive regulatory protein